MPFNGKRHSLVLHRNADEWPAWGVLYGFGIDNLVNQSTAFSPKAYNPVEL